MAKKSKTEEYQLLILDKLDQHGNAIEKLRDEVVEIKTNHLAHIATDIALLKEESRENSDWIKNHEARQQENEDTNRGNHWAFWAAVVTGICTIVAAAAVYIFK